MPRISDLIAEFTRLVRFGIVGVTATLVYTATTFAAVGLLAFPPVRASILGQVAAMGISYFGHSLFSFAVKTDHRIYLWRFLVIAALTFSMNGTMMWVLINVLGLHYRISVGIIGVLIPLANYVCNRFWVFLPGLRASPAIPGSERVRRNAGDT